MQMRFQVETSLYTHIHTSISSAGISSSRLCLVLINDDRIMIIPFACASNGACVHVRDENCFDNEEREREREEQHYY